MGNIGVGTTRTVSKMYQCCNRHRFFTNGTNDQYSKLFTMTEDPDVTLLELSAVIYLCSEGYSRKDILDILRREVV